MFSLGKSKRFANIVINDYAIRLIENNGKDLTSIKIIEEKQIPQDTILNGKIIDDILFFNFMKEVVKDWGIKGRNARFFVPNSLVVMREINIPTSVREDDLEAHIAMEMGKTIHLPFENPVFDFVILPKKQVAEGEQAPTTYKIALYAAPEAEIVKYIEVFSDVGLEPTDVDVEPLGVYRYYLAQNNNIDMDSSYLFIELNLTSVNMSIFQAHQLKLLRYQPTDFHTANWDIGKNANNRLTYEFKGPEEEIQPALADFYKEIERILNFFRFSVHQGEKEIKYIILTGDFPYLDLVVQTIKNHFGLDATILFANDSTIASHELGPSFIPALGLGLKGDK